MIQDVFTVISPARRDTARAALVAALGPNVPDAIMPVTGGVSGASVFQVAARGRRCLLRIEGPASPLRNPHQYVAMRIAADAGIAPRLHYVDERGGVAVMDFIADQPLKLFPGGPRALAQALGEMLRRLRATPAFPPFMDYPQIVARLWAHVCRSGLFAPGLLDPATQRLERIRETFVWEADELVSSHNDLLPRNVLFDGQRLWLIDWESAYRNDPLVDLATALDNFAPTPELEEELLRASLGRRPDQRLRGRLATIRALTRLYYAGVLFSASAAHPRAKPDADLSAPTPAELQQALRAGHLTPDMLETRHVLGKMFLDSFLTGGTPPGLPPPFSQFELGDRGLVRAPD